jgi:hypothetical protein
MYDVHVEVRWRRHAGEATVDLRLELFPGIEQRLLGPRVIPQRDTAAPAVEAGVRVRDLLPRHTLGLAEVLLPPRHGPPHRRRAWRTPEAPRARR